MKYYCNPVNTNYRYQFNQDPRMGGLIQICREAADPSMICYKGRYYIFASMTLGVWVSDDLVNWENHRLPSNLPLYDYAPDVRVIGGWVYFSASSRDRNCDYYRTQDILNGPYERIEGTFSFWDPNLFVDDDDRIYFYWGCSNVTPIYGVELDPVTMRPKTEPRELIFGAPDKHGYERMGEDHAKPPASEEEIDAKFNMFVASQGATPDMISQEVIPLIRGMFSNLPFIEGAWMDKHNGKYYLQYACPAAENNIYADGVYVGKSPLGPFELAENNPYSYKPGGFLPGAGHGSTMEDMNGNLWHAATMRISVNHDFERRVGLWPAGFDEDGELFCNQRYGDWPISVSGGKDNPWKEPEWMLLSSGKSATASSFCAGNEPEKAVEENVRTWWRAQTTSREEWLQVDLKDVYDVRAIQINFADDHIDIPVPGEIRQGSQARYVEEADHVTQWELEGSVDGKEYFVIENKSDAQTDLTHDLIVRENGISVRYLRLSNIAVAYEQLPCVSGLRVFGKANGEKPAVPKFTAQRTGDMDMDVTIEEADAAIGYNILFGSSPDKLYHNYMVFQAGTKGIGALIQGREYYVQVDAFNESGITHGTCVKLSK